MSQPTEREKFESCALVRAGSVIAEGKWESLCHSQQKGDVTITYAPLRDIGRWDSAPRKRCWHAETTRAHATVGRYATRDAAIKAAIKFTA